MSFSTNLFTEKGRALQSKVLAGAALNFTRIGMGSGSLGGQSQIALNNLIDQKVSLNVTQVSKSGNYAVVEGNFRNADISTGFYWRELGIFAQDPDIGEILYCYGNAGSLAEYIPPQSSEIIEKVVSLSIIVGDTANVTLLTDSTAFATKAEVKAAKDKAEQAFTQAGSGKEAIKAAITGIDPTVTIPTDATFAQLAAAIGQIETGIDTSDATVTAGDIIAPKTAYGPEGKITGTMANNGAINQALAVNGTYIIPKGYHNGSGKVTQSISTKAAQTYIPGTANQTIAAQQYLNGVQTILGDAGLIPANILNTANIFGVQGAAIAGKRFVSGTAFSGTAQYTFWYRGGGGNAWYGITISGLTFKPSVIVCMFRDTRNDGTSYAGDSYTIYSPITGYAMMFTAYDNNGQYSISSYQVNAGDCYVNASGFRLPALPNVTYNWMAWE